MAPEASDSATAWSVTCDLCYGTLMKLRERWAAVPGDVRLAYAAAGGFLAWFAVRLLAGPDQLMLLSSVLVFAALAALAVFVACRLVVRRPRRQRAAALLLVCGCIAALVVVPAGDIDDLHLIGRVYLAGGPNALNAWGQDLIRQHRATKGSEFVEPDTIPSGIRTYLAPHASVGGSIWSDEVVVRIELGGGFYHYGVAVFSSETQRQPEWWQRALGWPPEVVVYHEE